MSVGDESFSGLSTAELRAAVRAVLLDVLPAAVTENTSEVATGGSDTVTMQTDADLNAFVRRVAQLCEDPAQRAALRSGRRRFRLSAPQGATGAVTSTPATRSSARRVEHGAVTERAVKKAAADGVGLVLGRRAVMTPLARDKARLLGVEIEKER